MINLWRRWILGWKKPDSKIRAAMVTPMIVMKDNGKCKAQAKQIADYIDGELDICKTNPLAHLHPAPAAAPAPAQPAKPAERKCPKCGRTLAVRTRRDNGVQFLSCPGYRDGCKHSEDL